MPALAILAFGVLRIDVKIAMSVSIILACMAWMFASDVLALNKPEITATVTLPKSIFTEKQVDKLDDDGKVVEYLNPKSWLGHQRDGSRGQVMDEIPMHYFRFITDGTKRRAMISEFPLPGYKQIPLQYVSAYQASLQRSTTKLASVVNDTADYRGGGNQDSYDGTSATLLGRPATSISRTNFRDYARNRKTGRTEGNCTTYQAQKRIFWLFAIESATLHTQEA